MKRWVLIYTLFSFSFTLYAQITIDTDQLYTTQEKLEFQHTTYIDSLIFNDTDWKIETVKSNLVESIIALKKCKVRVMGAKLEFVDIDSLLKNSTVKENGYITEDELFTIGELTEKQYAQRGLVVLYLRYNGSVDRTIGEALSGKRQISVFYYGSLPYKDHPGLLTTDYQVQYHENVTLHEIVHLLSGDFSHPENKEKHILHGNQSQVQNVILDSHCELIRNSPLVN